MIPDYRESAIELVTKERDRQETLWGSESQLLHGDLVHYLDVKLRVLMEEVGEAAKDVNDHKYRVDEFVQVAAVATAIVEGILEAYESL